MFGEWQHRDGRPCQERQARRPAVSAIGPAPTAIAGFARIEKPDLERKDRTGSAIFLSWVAPRSLTAMSSLALTCQ